jgi:diguanylate cyclase (GGDEF)-like protein
MAREELADVLSEFARTMVTDFPIQGILDHLVKRIVDIMPVTAAGVTLISPGVQPRYIAASNGSALRFERLQTELGEGPCVAAYHTGEAISVPDLRSEDRFPKFSPQAVAAGLAAVFTFPLNHGDLRLGALDLYRDTPGPLSPTSMGAAQTLADVASAYLLNAQARSDLEDSSERSREAALHDPLTGLPNRILLLERLEHAFLRARRSGKIAAVLFVDVDRFKEINDTYGHQAGDNLLVAVGERLTAALRPGDTLARLSGDEFVILCDDLDERSQADAIVARVEGELARPFVVADTDVTVSGSVGVAFSGRGDEAPAELLHQADVAMYAIKRRRSGRGQVLDLRDLAGLAMHQDDLAEALPGAAGRGELRLEYQPIVAAADGQIIGVEALLRWTHADRGLVSPSVLIPLAEHSGLIAEVGGWVLEQCWSDRQRWQIQHGQGLAVAVNVSAQQFMSAGFASTVAAVLDSAAIDPKLLILDVTERLFVRDSERALIVLRDLKDIGVAIALDDFGTGYSSLSHLRRYPVDTIKIDRELVANLARDAATAAVVTAVIHLAHDLGMTVISEGVETTEQHHMLTKLGCDSCQGFYFARPMPASGLTELIRHATNGHTPCLPTLPAAINAKPARPT